MLSLCKKLGRRDSSGGSSGPQDGISDHVGIIDFRLCQVTSEIIFGYPINAKIVENKKFLLLTA